MEQAFFLTHNNPIYDFLSARIFPYLQPLNAADNLRDKAMNYGI